MEQISTGDKLSDGHGDAVLLLGFGGPESMSDVSPFLSSILFPDPTRSLCSAGRTLSPTDHSQAVPDILNTAGRPPVYAIPPERLRKIEARYASVNGFSPFCGEVRQFAEYLEMLLGDLGTPMPVFCANLHSRPTLDEVLETLWRQRKSPSSPRRIFVQVLTPFSGYYAYGKYVESLTAAIHHTHADFFESQVTWQILPILCEMDGYVEAVGESVAKALQAVPDAYAPRLLFTAHSVPLDMPGVSDYRRQIHEVAEAVMSTPNIHAFDPHGQTPYDVAWQSRTGRPSQPWLGPSPVAMVESVGRTQVSRTVNICKPGKGNDAEVKRSESPSRSAYSQENSHSLDGIKPLFWLVVPIGFLFENLELTFDLDQEVAAKVAELGGAYGRVSAVGSPVDFFFSQSCCSQQPIGQRATAKTLSSQNTSRNLLARIVACSILSRYRGPVM